MKIPLVIFSSQDFDDLPTRKHLFARHFSDEGHKVLYIEAPFTYLSKYADSTYKPKAKRARRVEKKSDNLWVASPPPMMPFYGRFGFAQKMACNKLAGFAKRAMLEIGFSAEYAALFYLPWMSPVRDSLNPKITLYDCVDDHSGYGGTSSATFLSKAEAKLANGCDAVFATARYLADNLRQYNPNTIHLPNAVDPEVFKFDKDESEPNKPTVVYVGALRWWFDSELMFDIASSRPNYRFVVIGQERGSELGEFGQKLRKLENVEFLGRKPQPEIPKLVYGASCGIIPFKSGELTKSVSPLKLYEYAAMGFPTVSVLMSELTNMPDSVVKIANNRDEFLEAIDGCIKTPANADEIAEFVKNNSWESRVNVLKTELQRLWQEKLN
ncbi:MAG TPA: glycosyltransferase [Caldisericia bacterium]|nr:glycosyltransferase [Caldisericia bacterium]HPF48338.1 glycosyltransferase [Caldisericia bacterium]HPI83483.1 glycosyltransferase [Caldisericia bacterium]HPQ92791.1 glycosyltransferase [Caldisericia bacterium]HRV74111.1 glycosyltransferase [Caldisericia bacterium]